MKNMSNDIVNKTDLQTILKEEINENQKLIEENSNNIKQRVQTSITIGYINFFILVFLVICQFATFLIG